ncbi:unnamed protein product [Adineta steineri]|uniref:Phytanoyl-CoA dioxygenase n=2 Tax=Adineta steineri TaxID=433720 RepID=A0A818FRD1_9BILA|nr:unnamed protein product [Adineta steineri]CAF3479702.1 unnamed protein product [Adineta steineri]
MNTPKFESPKDVEVDYDVDSPRFSVENIDEIQQGISHLDEHGYAVFSNILSNDEINTGIDLLWKHFENLKEPYHIRRDNPQTWNKPWPGIPHNGLVNDEGIGQSEFMWFVRGNPNIKKVFSHIWNSNELFVSFDGAGCFRDWRLNKNWKTAGGWYHMDQNPFTKPNRCSIQGLVSLTDADESTGGLVVVPDSHKHFLELKSITDEKRLYPDYLRVPYKYPLLEKLRPRLIKCKAGDLVVWDSRCMHCNTPALIPKEKNSQSELLRVVCYICMSPLSMFKPDVNEYENIEEFRSLRENCVRQRTTCTHWPLQIIPASEDYSGEIKPLKLNRFQQSLIIGTNVKPEDGTGEIYF